MSINPSSLSSTGRLGTIRSFRRHPSNETSNNTAQPSAAPDTQVPTHFSSDDKSLSESTKGRMGDNETLDQELSGFYWNLDAQKPKFSCTTWQGTDTKGHKLVNKFKTDCEKKVDRILDVYVITNFSGDDVRSGPEGLKSNITTKIEELYNQSKQKAIRAGEDMKFFQKQVESTWILNDIKQIAKELGSESAKDGYLVIGTKEDQSFFGSETVTTGTKLLLISSNSNDPLCNNKCKRLKDFRSKYYKLSNSGELPSTAQAANLARERQQFNNCGVISVWDKTLENFHPLQEEVETVGNPGDKTEEGSSNVGEGSGKVEQGIRQETSETGGNHDLEVDSQISMLLM